TLRSPASGAKPSHSTVARSRNPVLASRPMRRALVVLFAVLVAFPGPADAGVRAAPGAPAAIHVDMFPGGSGTGNVDETPPGTVNASKCDANLDDFSEHGYLGWEPADHDPVNDVNLICATATDSSGKILSGQQIQLTTSGP